ncbi:MAG: helix-turn-helix domain-containing protein [Gemmatimonadales bacterium]|nr:helix-turn-helix domain-containing protein [Gemmatimonadales bacterium]
MTLLPWRTYRRSANALERDIPHGPTPPLHHRCARRPLHHDRALRALRHSRTAGYKWVDRAEAGGRAALADRSPAPYHCPHRIPATLAERLCAARRAHPQWGPKKLLQYLGPRHRRVTVWPAISTVGDLLVREGLVTKRRRRRRSVHPGIVPPHTTEPNDLWAAGFKGQFRTGGGVYCYPLTITDQHSRYLLTCHSLRNVRTVFEWVAVSIKSRPTHCELASI